MPDNVQKPAAPVRFHVHLVSDSTGETLMDVMRASVAQFEGVEPVEHLYALVRSPRQMEMALKEIDAAPGLVMYTLVNSELRRALENRCADLGVPAIAILDPILATLSGFLNLPMSSRAGAQHDLDAEYYARIEALNYAIVHDDGQGSNLEGADVVLLGVSRTSKTPTCIYLAHRGVKAANIPLVRGASLPPNLASLKKPLIVGLTAQPERIVQIRRNRLLSLNEERDTDYIDDQRVRDEIVEAKRLFAKHGWPVIDVSRRSIEETSAKIINLLNKRRQA
ncbi:pyruvate, water dikinase regulatory protein [Hyphobacterium marinum]|uniref:Putative pyruvate, phosphate dikinase regulatory protein n=1 Tax=Hyphobacterium marinum TaxID=3116574 RepID=A0ABU7LUZ5_9PROT|nr:pyruvate, water dikinase regulatory protein [Hyphobacterium sp. Y6023]MEE2565376.1 pyruvate, water dikinase regulatory protein [Hyphobacterium sp. Y6023]